MKKIYETPNIKVVKVQVENHFMDMSPNGSLSIGSGVTDDDGFAKENDFDMGDDW